MNRRLRMKVTKIQRRTILTAILRSRCPVCECEVEMLDTAGAAGILEIEIQRLEDLILTGRIHSIQTITGNRWICKSSLFET